MVKTVTNEEVGKEELGGAYTHSSKSGVTHFMCDNEEETLMSKMCIRDRNIAGVNVWRN